MENQPNPFAQLQVSISTSILIQSHSHAISKPFARQFMDDNPISMPQNSCQMNVDSAILKIIGPISQNEVKRSQ